MHATWGSGTEDSCGCALTVSAELKAALQKSIWSDTVGTPEDPAEVREVAETARNGDLGDVLRSRFVERRVAGGHTSIVPRRNESSFQQD
jgi:hypothetical protein